MVEPLDPITAGKDFNFFDKITISNTSFTNDAQVVITFRGPHNLNFILESGGPVQYSFNGNTVHGDMTNDTPSEQRDFRIHAGNKIWFRLTSAGSATIRIEAWHIGL